MKNHGIVPERVGDGLPESVSITPGSIVVIREGTSYSWGHFWSAEASAVTAKLVKLKQAPGIWAGKQIRREQVLLVAASKEEADQICQALTGIRGENDRRRKVADQARVAAIVAADAASDKQMTALLSRLNKGQTV